MNLKLMIMSFGIEADEEYYNAAKKWIDELENNPLLNVIRGS